MIEIQIYQKKKTFLNWWKTKRGEKVWERDPLMWI